MRLLGAGVVGAEVVGADTVGVGVIGAGVVEAGVVTATGFVGAVVAGSGGYEAVEAAVGAGVVRARVRRACVVSCAGTDLE